MMRHPKKPLLHPWNSVDSKGVASRTAGIQQRKGSRRNGTSSPSPRPTVRLVNRVRSFQPRLIFASDEAGGTPCELVISRSGTLTSTPSRVSTMYVCASSSR